MDDVKALPPWGQGIQPDPSRPLHGCPWIDLAPLNFIVPSGPKPILFRTWDEVTQRFPTWDAMQAAVATWDSLMQGHPGYDGGAPSLPAGTGATFGVTTYDGCEWWVTNVEGLLDSAPWEASTVRPATQDGEWLKSVSAAGRAITIEGTVIAPSRLTLERAVRQAMACLATPPRTGWLRYRDSAGDAWRLPVVLTEKVRVKATGDHSFDVQINVKGVDIRTAGAGVHLESDESPAPVDLLPWNSEVGIEVGGYVPSWPTITVTGRVAAGAVVTFPSLGDGVPVTVKLLREVAAGQTLRIDCRRRRVVLERVGASEPVRGAVEVNRWPLMPVGPATVKASGTGTGHVSITVTDLA